MTFDLRETLGETVTMEIVVSSSAFLVCFVIVIIILIPNSRLLNFEPCPWEWKNVYAGQKILCWFSA